jgi:hypothetical protein
MNPAMRARMEALRDSVPKPEYNLAIDAVSNCSSLGRSLEIPAQDNPCGCLEMYVCSTNEGMPSRRGATTTYHCLQCQFRKLGIT